MPRPPMLLLLGLCLGCGGGDPGGGAPGGDPTAIPLISTDASTASPDSGVPVTRPPPTAQGPIPSGLPPALLVGLFENTGETWMKSSGAGWNARYRYFVKGWVDNWGWGSPDG